MDNLWNLLSKEIERAIKGISLHHVIADACDKALDGLDNAGNEQAAASPALAGPVPLEGSANVRRTEGEHPALPGGPCDEDGEYLRARVELF
jgi:hypothetical protein